MHSDTLHAIGNPIEPVHFQAVEHPHLHSIVDIRVILDVLHLSNGFKSAPIYTSLDNHPRRCGHKLVAELVRSGREADLDVADLGGSIELDVEGVFVVVGLFNHWQEDNLALVAFFVGGPVGVVGVHASEVEVWHQLDMVSKLLIFQLFNVFPRSSDFFGHRLGRN